MQKDQAIMHMTVCYGSTVGESHACRWEKSELRGVRSHGDTYTSCIFRKAKAGVAQKQPPHGRSSGSRCFVLCTNVNHQGCYRGTQ
jgi:hypothetical protein